jgi:hypothetical protein
MTNPTQPTQPSPPSLPPAEETPNAARWTGMLSLSEFILRESQPTMLDGLRAVKDLRWSGGVHEVLDEVVVLEGAQSAMPSEVAQRAVGDAMVLGAVAGGALAAARNYPALMKGEMDGAAYAGQVVTGAAVVGVGSAGRSAATLALKAGASAVARRVGAAGLKRFAGSTAGTMVALAVVEQSVDTVQFARGRISGAEYGARSANNASALGGGYGGAVAGAAVGSAVPGVGTAVGALLGGVLGALSASAVARTVTDALRRG